MQQSSHSKYYCIPLKLEEEIYKRVNDIPAIEASAEILALYGGTRFETIEAKAEIQGNLYSTIIYTPKKKNDFAYVIADENYIPIDVKTEPVISAESEWIYFKELENGISQAETLSAEQNVDLRFLFITPEFSSIEPSAIKNSSHKETWNNIFDQRRVVILGDPGAGKTTCLRRIAIELASPNIFPNRPHCIPIYVPLRFFNSSPLGEDELKGILLRHNGQELADGFTELSSQGRFVILLDGLDEVSDSERGRIISSIKILSSKYPSNRLYISLRRQDYDWSFSDFRHWELQPFSFDQVKELSCQLIYPQKSWKFFITRLKETPEIMEITRNPLMLSVAALLYTRYSITPNCESELLKGFVQTLVEDWDAARSVNRASDQWASPRHKVIELCNWAFHLGQKGDFSFSSDDFVKWYEMKQEDVSGEKFLSVLALHTGLIYQTDSEKWKFANEVIAEYLRASALVQNTADCSRLLRRNMSNPSWQKTLTLAQGITLDATHLMELLWNSDEIDLPTKVLLASDALSQTIELQKTSLERICQDIIAFLERKMRHLQIARKGSRVSGSTPPLWHVTLQNATGRIFLDTSQGVQLRSLLRSIYKARSGPAKQYLFDALENSKLDCVRQLAPSLKVEGEWGDKLRKTSRFEYLDLSVNPESPEINVK